MDDVIALAKQLGKKIGENPRTKAFIAAAKAVAEDREAQTILNDFQIQMDKMRTAEQSGSAIEPADKRRAAELEMKLASNDKLKAMMRTQADYLQMMQIMQSAIDEAAEGD